MLRMDCFPDEEPACWFAWAAAAAAFCCAASLSFSALSSFSFCAFFSFSTRSRSTFSFSFLSRSTFSFSSLSLASLASFSSFAFLSFSSRSRLSAFSFSSFSFLFRSRSASRSRSSCKRFRFSSSFRALSSSAALRSPPHTFILFSTVSAMIVMLTDCVLSLSPSLQHLACYLDSLLRRDASLDPATCIFVSLLLVPPRNRLRY